MLNQSDRRTDRARVAPFSPTEWLLELPVPGQSSVNRIGRSGWRVFHSSTGVRTSFADGDMRAPVIVPMSAMPTPSPATTIPVVRLLESQRSSALQSAVWMEPTPAMSPPSAPMPKPPMRLVAMSPRDELRLRFNSRAFAKSGGSLCMSSTKRPRSLGPTRVSMTGGVVGVASTTAHSRGRWWKAHL